MKDAKSEVERAHAQSDLNAFTTVFELAKASVLTVPNRPLDSSELPKKVELGGLTAMIESYPGHSGTDMVVCVPEQNVVYTGDLLVNGWYPACLDEKTTVSGWRATLKNLCVVGQGHVVRAGTWATLRAARYRRGARGL